MYTWCTISCLFQAQNAHTSWARLVLVCVMCMSVCHGCNDVFLYALSSSCGTLWTELDYHHIGAWSNACTSRGCCWCFQSNLQEEVWAGLVWFDLISKVISQQFSNGMFLRCNAHFCVCVLCVCPSPSVCLWIGFACVTCVIIKVKEGFCVLLCEWTDLTCVQCSLRWIFNGWKSVLWMFNEGRCSVWFLYYSGFSLQHLLRIFL